MLLNRNWIKLAVILLALLFNILPATAKTPVLELANTQDTSVSLTPFVEVLEDPSAQLTLSDVRNPTYGQQFAAQNVSSEALSFGFTRSAYWLRLTLHNGTDVPQTRLLEIANYALSTVDFYQPRV